MSHKHNNRIIIIVSIYLHAAIASQLVSSLCIYSGYYNKYSGYYNKYISRMTKQILFLS